MRNKKYKNCGNFIAVWSNSSIKCRNDKTSPFYSGIETKKYSLHYHWKIIFECNTKKELVQFAEDNSYDLSNLKFSFLDRNVCDYKIDNNSKICGLKNQISIAYFNGIRKVK